MGLNPRNKITKAISNAATAIFRVAFVKRTIDSGLAFLQANGHGDPDDAQNQELLQEDGLDHIQHIGFESYPVMDGDSEGIVVESDGGESCIAERRALPDDLKDLVSGEARTYGEDSQSLLHRSGGDNELMAKDGYVNRLGAGDSDAATFRNIAYSHTVQGQASQVAVADGLKAYMDKVDADLAAIKTDMTNIDALLTVAGTLVVNITAINAWILAQGGPVLGPPGVKAATTLVPTTAALAVSTDHSYVSTGSGTSEVEP